MWHPTHQPPHHGDELPAERRTVLVWLSTMELPFCGYIRHHSGGPFWVVYHGNTDIGTDVIFWDDALLFGPTPEHTHWMQGRGLGPLCVWRPTQEDR
jgi:hypothetical protein